MHWHNDSKPQSYSCLHSFTILDLNNHKVPSFHLSQHNLISWHAESWCKYPFLGKLITTHSNLLPDCFFHHTELLVICLRVQNFNPHPILIPCQEIQLLSEQPGNGSIHHLFIQFSNKCIAAPSRLHLWLGKISLSPVTELAHDFHSNTSDFSFHGTSTSIYSKWAAWDNKTTNFHDNFTTYAFLCFLNKFMSPWSPSLFLF